MGLPASTVTVSFRDINGLTTQRSYEGRIVALTDANAIALADALQALTQLEVVDLQVSRRVAGFTPIAAEANSSRSETASVKCELAAGGFHTFNLPAIKSTLKSGSNLTTSAAAFLTFLALFDDGGGAGGTAGPFFVNDGEELSELYIEAGSVSGKVNK